jgi:hypothetical protein
MHGEGCTLHLSSHHRPEPKIDLAGRHREEAGQRSEMFRLRESMDGLHRPGMVQVMGLRSASTSGNAFPKLATVFPIDPTEAVSRPMYGQGRAVL